jgi:type VI secretion system secreted protein VgrG
MSIPLDPKGAATSAANKAADTAIQNATAQVSGLKDSIAGGFGNISEKLSGFTDVKSLLPTGVSPYQQSNRLITLELDSGGIAGEQLIPQTVEGTEALGELYRFEITCFAHDANIELKKLLGLPARLGILTGAGPKFLRYGIITRTEALPTDGGAAHYKLTFEPPLALLRFRRTSRVFQDKTVPEIVQTIFDEHIATNPVMGANFAHRFELSDEERYPARSYCLQYRETDFEFVDRLLKEEGINYRFEHTEAPDEAPDDESDPSPDRPDWAIKKTDDEGTHPLVTFVAFDNPDSLPQASQSRIRFHRANATEADDTFTRWTSTRKLGVSRVALASFEYKAVTTLTADADTQTDQGNQGSDAQSTLEDYDAQTLYYGDQDDMARYAFLRQQAYDRRKKVFYGEGSVRQLQAGDWFELASHPQISNRGQKEREFVVVRLSLVAHNNVPDGQKNLSPKDAPPPYRIAIEAQRRGIPLIPDFAHTHHAKPRSHGLQSATVVGPIKDANAEGASVPMPDEVYTDALGRIRIQFHWQRSAEHPEFGADWDEKSSCWVRVAHPSAGAGWGHQFIPRIGQEVLVDFLEGDIDRPLITNVVYNGSHPPPAFSDEGSLPANRALSGIKTKEHEKASYKYGEILFDDSPGEVRTKLSSEHGKTQLNQGYLIHPRRDGSGTPRGDGFELRTDLQGALRAGQGLFITTEPSTNANGNQLDRGQAQAQLDAARSLAGTLSESAENQLAEAAELGPDRLNADGKKEDQSPTGHLHHLTEAVRAWEGATNTDPEGKSATEEHPGRQPVFIAHGAEGLGMVTSNEMVLTSGENLDTVSQRDTQQTTARRWLHNVGQTISLFVFGILDKVSLKIIAGLGNLLLHAQSGDVETVGEQNVRVHANNKTFTLTAGKELTVTCAGAYVRLSGGKIEVHAPGNVTFKGADYSFGGPTSLSAPAEGFPMNELVMEKEKFVRMTDFSG